MATTAPDLQASGSTRWPSVPCGLSVRLSPPWPSRLKPPETPRRQLISRSTLGKPLKLIRLRPRTSGCGSPTPCLDDLWRSKSTHNPSFSALPVASFTQLDRDAISDCISASPAFESPIILNVAPTMNIPKCQITSRNDG
jgi:hypothetical protein